MYLPGEGEALDNELLLIEFILWGVPIWLKELRRGARGVAVGVVEADEAAELLRLWLYRIAGDAVARGKVLHLGDIAAMRNFFFFWIILRIEKKIKKRSEGKLMFVDIITKGRDLYGVRCQILASLVLWKMRPRWRFVSDTRRK